MKRDIILPPTLTAGDSIAVVSPASVIDPALVERASATLRQMGYIPVVMPHALGAHGSFSASATDRLNDLTEALRDPAVKAVLCSRGGYGAVHLLDGLDTFLATDSAIPKWLIGFSDISALHALWHKHSIASIHGSMARQLAAGIDTEYAIRLEQILTTAQMPAIEWTNDTNVANRDGIVSAPVVGGNLAVLDALIGTPYNMLEPGNILFIEDIAEPIYKIERMLYHLELAGILPRLAGLIVGRFTEYNPDKNYSSMEQMIERMVSRFSFPVAFGSPIGHIGDSNMPVINGLTMTLTVRGDCCALR
ncbi:MAG: LD-carboxypeptidase [Clostridiales bacterium]|nr:LD-carboxypeptidase [Clostridiales bacterium]